MIKNILYVEDGSVDVDELEQKLGDETYVIVYRQGATPPVLVQPENPIQAVTDEIRNRHYSALVKLDEIGLMKMSKKLRQGLKEVYQELQGERA